ncbi:single-strand-binding protein [Carboxydothermus islandicus]|uniref:Single-stranded DNA-binding protein n=1 Tax=Carboxydothermus islandicus TaxID=661089 RepID=A0A1L8D0W9_9THEO|nr:single-stranded DNA-binding protein [Carboxydothermus islandicus]GAV24783.1 single-strand-binding protein [Carboxydothermus islandicus]
MFNRIILIGRLTRDPELRYTQNGTTVATMTVAVNRPYTTKEGEKEADFIDVIAWNKLAEIVNEYGQKGRLALVEGRLQIRSYTDKEEKKRKVAEVVANNVRFLDKPKQAESGEEIDWSDFGTEIEVDEEDIPF